MQKSPGTDAVDYLDTTANIVATYVSNNAVPPSELCALIASVHRTLGALAAGQPDTDPDAKPTAAQIRKSVTPDGIVSFLDGRSYKTLKRHVGAHGLDPRSAYRERFGLPENYPMVAAVYAAQRSALAKTIGLGRVSDRNRNPKPKPEGR